MSRHAPANVRENPARLRNLRVLYEELGLVLEELTEMSDEDRAGAHGHEEHLEGLLDRMRRELGQVGPSRAQVARRRQERIAETLEAERSRP